MSFILDALRKSEHARQSLGSTNLAELPLGRRQRSQPWWILAIAALLLINLIVLLLVLFRDSTPKTVPAQQITATPVPPPAAVSRQPVVQQAAPSLVVPQPVTRSLAEEAQPAQVQYESVPRSEASLAASVPDGPALVRHVNAPEANSAVIAANGLPDLRIDMHVFAKAPADRFVFINMHKYTEGQTMVEGPVLEQITTDGVILFYKGQQLRLQRP